VVKGLFHVSGMNYWTFDGINVTWNDANSTSLHMVRFKNGIGWTFKNAEVWGAKSFAAVNVLSSVSGQPANWTIANNCIHDTYGDPAHGTAKDQLLYVNTGVNAGPGLIERNLLFNAPRGKAVKLAGPVSGTGSAFVTVRYNTIDNSNKPGVVVGWATHDSSVYRNLVVKTNDVSLIRGYQLTGANNKAWDNYGYQGPALVSSDSGYPQTLHDMGGEVFPRNPTFDNTTCSGFHPQDTMAQAYGRYAP